MKTKDKLAEVLREAGLSAMAEKAASGYYDDYESPEPMPINQLADDLTKAGRKDLANRAMDGEWDATAEESAAWYEREGKYLILGHKH